MDARESANSLLGRLDVDAVAARRWFATKGRVIEGFELVEALSPPGAVGALLVVADLLDDDGESTRYALALRDGVPITGELAAEDPLWRALAQIAGYEGGSPEGTARELGGDQSNTAVVVDERVVVKLRRVVEAGIAPEVELLGALAGVEGVPELCGAVELGGGTVVVLQSYVDHVEGGWEPFIERVVAAADGAPSAPLVADAQRLGALLARVHGALAMRLGVTHATAEDVERRRAVAVTRLAAVRAALAKRAPDSALGALARGLDGLAAAVGTPLCRIHGDVHVGQTLRARDGALTLVDFDGEPGGDIELRRRPWTPLFDLASLLLSFDHAAAAARRRADARSLDTAPIDSWADTARAVALDAWRAGVAGTPIGFDDALLQAVSAEKQVAELSYATRFLPEWLYAPLEVLGRRFT